MYIIPILLTGSSWMYRGHRFISITTDKTPQTRLRRYSVSARHLPPS